MIDNSIDNYDAVDQNRLQINLWNYSNLVLKEYKLATLIIMCNIEFPLLNILKTLSC